MIAEHNTISCETNGDSHIIDLTANVQETVAESGIDTGQAALLVPG